MDDEKFPQLSKNYDFLKIYLQSKNEKGKELICVLNEQSEAKRVNRDTLYNQKSRMNL